MSKTLEKKFYDYQKFEFFIQKHRRRIINHYGFGEGLGFVGYVEYRR